jgi:hypothetical protein
MLRTREWIAAVLLALVVGAAGCRDKGSDPPRVPAEEPPTDAPFPQTLSIEPAADLQKRLAALAVMDIAEAGSSFRVIVLREGTSDYGVVFYKRSGQQYVPFGPALHPLGFEVPTVSGEAPPVIRARHRASGEGYHFEISSEAVDLVPDSGSWEPVRPGVAVNPRSVPPPE